MKRKDDFSIDTKNLLAHRVGMQCSNPNCRQPTSGPSTTLSKSVNIGVAAHISAASPGGPRYDSSLSSTERCSPDNGIWCCQNCAKLIDNDPEHFTVDILKRWKSLSEEAARLAIESPSQKISDLNSDRELIQFYAQCFDRPAFQDYFAQEGSVKAFDKAIEDTITAINTGCLQSREGKTLSRAKGKSYIQNVEWRNKLDTIVELLRAIRSRYELGIKLKTILSNGDWYCINDRSTANWMDQTRSEILDLFGTIADEADVHSPRWKDRHRLR